MSIVAIDLGTKRVGIAVSTSGVLASPDRVIEHPGSDELLVGKIIAIGEELEAESFVLGVPKGGRLDAAAVVEKYGRFAQLLRQNSCKEVVLWDEAYTTTEAARLRNQAGKSRKNYKEQIDMQAAAVLLQDYLDHRRSS